VSRTGEGGVGLDPSALPRLVQEHRLRLLLLLLLCRCHAAAALTAEFLAALLLAHACSC